MSFSVERRLGFWVCAVVLASAVPTRAEPSIASLLRGRDANEASDPTAELSQLLEALAQRPFANAENVQAALREVRSDLALLKALYAAAAPAARVKRCEQIVWAGLSWVDRLEARAALATHAAAVRAELDRAGKKPSP